VAKNRTDALAWSLRALGRGLLVLVVAAAARAQPIDVVAAEKVYGDIAGQIGGAAVAVTSILANPGQDPHDFEASAATARAIADAQVVIYNGAGYDPWVVRLLSASRSRAREVIEVAALAGAKAGDNPHVWYDTAAVNGLARTLAARFGALDPAHAPDFAQRLAAFTSAMRALERRIAALRERYAGTPVTATEPVFGYMADALGLRMRNARFQLAVMNGTEPGAATIAAFERDLRTRAVAVLLYNAQTSQALAERMRAIADESGVAVVLVTETEPEGLDYPAWMLAQLDALERALARQ
jgi:zinc/manganese transport system substrate-binding protein